MKRWPFALLGLLVLGATAFILYGTVKVPAQPSPAGRPVLVKTAPPPNPTSAAAHDAAAAPLPAHDDAARQAAQAYFAAHIDRLKQIAFTDYPQALEKRKALSAWCAAVKKWGNDYRDRFQREHEKGLKLFEQLEEKGHFEKNSDGATLYMLSLPLFLADGLHDDTVIVEGSSVSDMMRALALEPVWSAGMAKTLAQMERELLHDNEAAARADAVQSGPELLAYIEGAEARLRLRSQDAARRVGLSAEEAELVLDLAKSRWMQDATSLYQNLPDIAHQKIYAEYRQTVYELRGLLDQAADGEEKRAMLTELADLQAQMRTLGKG